MFEPERQAMIDLIEGMSGCLGIWHEWPDAELTKLYEYFLAQVDLASFEM
jgi:hypothetical protein